MTNFENLFKGIYKDKKVLITGHTGFKGSWLTLWLLKMGAKVIGYSKDIPSNPSHYDLLFNNSQFSILNSQLISVFGNIQDQDKLNSVLNEHKPDIVFHLAAQPLVRLSYEDPIETYETNVIGTLKVFEACKKANVKAIVNITSDKCYKNREWVWGYRENDPMGGYDPYSSSKGCAELLTSSYRNSYFNLNDYGIKHNTLLASCRAGNVIGGGDWAKDRLIADIMVAVTKDEKVKIRNPQATRPWQHVLEPLSGYLTIGQKLLEGKKEFAEAWNFGPSDEGSITVEQVVKNIKKHWNKVDYEVNSQFSILNSQFKKHEANLLKLDCSKAHIKLKWKNVWDNQKTFEVTTNWYKAFYEKNIILTLKDLEDYIIDAKSKNIEWTVQ
jgi:CDP-glucose 4,6-dehydratase